MSLRTATESEAVQLFAERAKTVVSDFVVSERNANAVAQICRRLDGIPLALELAAARMTALSVDELAARLDDRFRLLTGGRRTALPRQRTLRALVDWSYDLLSHDERAVLMNIAIFAGGFTLDAVLHVFANTALGETAVIDAIQRLVDKSLLVADHDHNAETRYRLLETIRQYAAEKLVDAGGADAARRRHFAYFLALAERAEPELRRPNVLEWLDRLEAEHDNLRAALDWAADTDPRGYAGLAGALHEFWDMRGHFTEGFERLERAVSIHQAEDPARLKALLGTGALSYRLDKRQYSADLLDATAALARRLSDRRREAEATLWRACALDAEGPAFIASMAEKGLALSRSIDHAWGIGFAMWHFALAEMLRGRPAEGQRLFLESASHFDRGGCMVMQALARTWAGQCAVDRFAFDEARTLLDEALAEHRRLGNVHDAGTTLRALAKLDLNAGDLAAALRASEESVTIFRALHDPNCGARSTLVQSEVLHAMGDYRLALRHAEESAAVEAQLGFHHNRAGALWLAGRSHEAQGDSRAARDAYFEGLREVMQATQRAQLPFLLEAIAGTHPDADAAPRLLGAASAMREARGAAVFPSERADVERWHVSVRAAHDAQFEHEFEVGRTMTHDDAIAAALLLDRRAT